MIVNRPKFLWLLLKIIFLKLFKVQQEPTEKSFNPTLLKQGCHSVGQLTLSNLERTLSVEAPSQIRAPSSPGERDRAGVGDLPTLSPCGRDVTCSEYYCIEVQRNRCRRSRSLWKQTRRCCCARTHHLLNSTTTSPPPPCSCQLELPLWSQLGRHSVINSINPKARQDGADISLAELQISLWFEDYIPAHPNYIIAMKEYNFILVRLCPTCWRQNVIFSSSIQNLLTIKNEAYWIFSVTNMNRFWTFNYPQV